MSARVPGCRTPAQSPRRSWAPLLAWLAAVLLAWPGAGRAHQASDAYLQLQAHDGRAQLRADVALRDLDLLLPTLDADDDRQLTWGEVRRAQALISSTVLGALQLGDCRFQPLAGELALERRADGVYAVVRAEADCRVDAGTPARWHLLAGVDDTHRALLRLGLPGEVVPRLRVLVPVPRPAGGAAPAHGLASASAPATAPAPDLATGASTDMATGASGTAAPGAHPPAAPQVATAMPEPASFVTEGVVHLLNGWDHLLFLVCLLLPAVLQRRGEAAAPRHGWQPVANLRAAAGPLLRTVTLFTLAHSITLALAALGRWQPAPWLIEPAIALTILVAAVDNLRPRLWRWRDALTFGFGLVHGFGFAGVLAELELPGSTFGWALLQFNLGLEAGQLALVALLLPLLMLGRHRALYVPAVLRGGSGLAAAVAAFWFVERCLGAAALAPV